MSKAENIIRMLQSKGFASTQELADRFQVSTRSIKRYFQLLREKGFKVIIKHDGRGRLWKVEV